MKISHLLVCLLIASSSYAQKDIAFRNVPLEEAKRAAAKENKLIFIDCYTSWCGPCKWMEKNAFTDPAVYNYYNATFINLKIDMEKGEGPDVRKAYKVQSYPTYLFLNSKGEIVHRSGSRMEPTAFLETGKTAFDPQKNLLAMEQKYKGGQRDFQFLLDYYEVLRKSDQATAEKIGSDIANRFPEADLQSALGWQVIKHLAKSETDRLGAYFMAQPDKFAAWASKEERDALTDMLISRAVYRLIYSGDDKAFFSRLRHFTDSDNPQRQKTGILMQAEYYQQNNNVDAYTKLTNEAMNGLLKNDAEKLSYLARRADKRGDGDKALLPQAYLMAKRAVVLNPDEYSIQGTFASVCLSLQKKEEGLIAARKACSLAETTKIQKIAEKLLSDIEKL